MSSTAGGRRPQFPMVWVLLPAGLAAAAAWLMPWIAGRSATLIRYNTLVVLLGTTVLGANAGLVGSFTVLRGRALVGDALAHAALPGLCLAFLVLGGRSLGGMLVGALGTGLLGVVLMTFLRRRTRIKDDAAMGTVRSVLFGVGVVLISLIQTHAVEGSRAGLDSFIFGKTAGMVADDVRLIAGVSLASLAVITLLFKEFELASFDPGFARVQGWPALLLDNLQMALAAVTTVIALPAVGAVLVAALLILPGASMRFWTDRLGSLLVGAAALGGIVGGVGTLLSAQFSLLPAGPIIILVGAALFTASMLVAPRRGLIARGMTQSRARRLRRRQRLLRAVYESAERNGDFYAPQPIDRVAPPDDWIAGERRRALADAASRGLIEHPPETAADNVRLTPAGLREAARVVRGYRLYESLFDDYPEQATAVVDLDVTAIDRRLPPEMLASSVAELQAAGRLPKLASHDAAPRREPPP